MPGFFTLRNPYTYMNGPTWYLSAMLLAMIVIYPIMKKFKDNFFYYIASVCFIFLTGITYQNYDNFDSMVVGWNGFLCSGLLRAFIGLLAGTLVYKFVECIKNKQYTMLMRVVFTFIELLCYLCAFLYMYLIVGGKLDWLIIIFFMIGITVSLSNMSLLGDIIKSKIFEWLGEFSFSLYLGHAYYRDIYKSRILEIFYLSINYVIINYVYIKIVKKFLEKIKT